LHFLNSIQNNYTFNEAVLFYLFIFGTKGVMWFIVKLCVGDFLLLLDIHEYDFEAFSLVFLAFSLLIVSRFNFLAVIYDLPYAVPEGLSVDFYFHIL